MKTKANTKRGAKQSRYKRRPLRNAIRAAGRFCSRVPWLSLVLCAAGFIALVAVEASVVDVVRKMASDPITAVIFAVSAALASLGVVVGPMAIRALPARATGQRKFAWKIVACCFVLSVWNLSTTLANATVQMTAHAVRSSPTFGPDVARLNQLNYLIDGLNTGQGNDTELARVTTERDVLQARLDKANPKPVMIAWENDGWVFWLKAGLFHALVAGFSSAFAFSMMPKRRSSKKAKAPAGWPYVEGEPVAM